MTKSNEDIYQSIDGIAAPGVDKDYLIHAAVSHAMGTPNWGLVEVADRGRFIVFPDGTEVFLFDGTPLLKFRKLIVEPIGNVNNTRTHYQYEVLYEVK